MVIIFPKFVNGDEVYAQTWKVLTLKNRIEPPKQQSFKIKREEFRIF